MCEFTNPSKSERLEMTKRCRDIADELQKMRLSFACTKSNANIIHRLFIASDALEDVGIMLEDYKIAVVL